MTIQDKFYDKYHTFLNTFDLSTSSTRSLHEMIVLIILIAMYGDDKADETFSLFCENRKTPSQTNMIDLSLYGPEGFEPDPYSGASTVGNGNDSDNSNNGDQGVNID